MAEIPIKTLKFHGLEDTYTIPQMADVKRANPYNYLDNSDFRNPVNQRGQTSYTAAGYTIDRWYAGAWSSNIAVTIENGGLRLSGGTAGAPNSCVIEQRLDATKLRGKTFTFVIKNSEFIAPSLKKICVFCDNNLIEQGTIVSGGIGLVVFTVSENAERITITVGNSASHGGADTIDALLEWAALYEGEYTAETLPEYRPKGFAHELLECQRYYVEIDHWALGTGYSGSSNDVSIFLQTPIQMRTVPTIICDGAIRARYGGTAYYTLDNCVIAAFDRGYSATMRLVGMAVSGITSYQVVAGYAESKFALSADL